MMHNSVVVIPALKPDKRLEDYIKLLIAEGISKIIVVDDGSGNDYADIFSRIRGIKECEVYTHELNQGKGKALKDALNLYMEKGYNKIYNGVITVDADGQHAVKDVLRISEKMSEQSDCLILGERKFDNNVPLRSRFGNSCTRIVFQLLYGMKLYDTQTGLRGIPNRLVPIFKNLEGDRYEYEMRMLMECSLRKIQVNSLIIETIYINDNESSHFDAVRDSLKIYNLLFGNFFKFLISSFSASVIDIGLFQLLIMLLRSKYEKYILFSTVGARFCSSLYNYFINKNVVFNSRHFSGRSIIKYYILCIVQMLVSATFVNLLYNCFQIHESIVKIIVDVILFFISYRIQRRFVFPIGEE